jgi:hypothetical protein
LSSGTAKKWGLRLLPWGAGIVALLSRIPYTIRYDLHFGGDFAVPYLMAKRILVGEFPIYFWEQNNQGTLAQYVAALFFRIFGASIPLAGFVTAMFWAVAIGWGVYYVQQHFGVKPAVFAAIAACVGVPHWHHYDSVAICTAYAVAPLLPMLFFWLALTTFERGMTTGRSILWGFFLGFGWYNTQQIVFSLVAIGVTVLLVPSWRGRLKEFIHFRTIGLVIVFAGVGISPNFLHKYNPNSPPPPQTSLADPAMMSKNFFALVRAIPTYFDGDPLKRLPENVWYWKYKEYEDSRPNSAVDVIAIIAAFITCSFIIQSFREAWQQKNAPVLLLAAYPLGNAFLNVVTAAVQGGYYPGQRYLLPSGVILMLWLGIKLARSLDARHFVTAAVLVLTLGLSVFHQTEIFQQPDQLADYRRLADELLQKGYRYAASTYGDSYVLTALTNERLIVTPLDYKAYPKYQEAVGSADKWVLILPAQAQIPPGNIRVFNHDYVRDGEPQSVGFFKYIPYKRLFL